MQTDDRLIIERPVAGAPGTSSTAATTLISAHPRRDPPPQNRDASGRARVLRLIDAVQLGAPIEGQDRLWLLAGLRQYIASGADLNTVLGL